MKRRGKPTKREAVKQSQSGQSKTEFRPPRTVEEFFAMSEQDQDIWANIGQVVTEVREGASRRRAAQKFGLNPRTVQKFARSALRKLGNGRWVAKPHESALARPRHSKSEGIARDRGARLSSGVPDRQILDCCRALPR